MKISPTSGSIASVSGSRIMMVLAALNPGMAPTIRPRKIAGRMIHQKVKVWRNISPKEGPLKIHFTAGPSSWSRKDRPENGC